MNKRFSWRIILSIVLIILVGLFTQVLTAQTPQPIVYTIKVTAPETRYAEVEAVIPTNRSATIELMMPVWSPGFYVVENYARRLENFSVHTTDGSVLQVVQPKNNRWQIQTNGAPTVVVSYRILCNGRSVTGSYVGVDYAIWNGTSTFVTLVEKNSRPYEIRIELASQWKQVISGLDVAPDGNPAHLIASDYDILVDSPIFAGNPIVTVFEVAGIKHYMVDVGELGPWDSALGAQDYEKIVQENYRFWGFLPYKKYVFFNLFRQGGGGLEHNNSCFLNLGIARSARPNYSSMTFVSHEYFHLFNVKRIRPVELGPFDYENPPRTSGLWVSEGVTTYYGNLLATRAGFGEPLEFLSRLSSDIRRLQTSPGRFVQSLEQASLDVFTSGMSGMGGGDRTISYYVKGDAASFLLDARIRHATSDKKSLDDLMRLAYQRYGGERGFTYDQFRETAEEVAGADLKEWFRKAISSTEELDYTEALDWFGLRFNTQDPARAWTLEIREDATESQKNHLQGLLKGINK